MEPVVDIQTISYVSNMNDYMCDIGKKLQRTTLIQVLRINVSDAILFFSDKHIMNDSKLAESTLSILLETIFDKTNYVFDLIMNDGKTFIFKIKHVLEMIYLEDKSQTNKYKYEECGERIKLIIENFKKIDDIQINTIDFKISERTNTQKNTSEKSSEKLSENAEQSESNELTTSSLEDNKKKDDKKDDGKKEDIELTNLYLNKKKIVYTKNVNTINNFLNNVLSILYQIQYILNNTTIDYY